MWKNFLRITNYEQPLLCNGLILWPRKKPYSRIFPATIGINEWSSFVNKNSLGQDKLRIKMIARWLVDFVARIEAVEEILVVIV